MRVLRYPIVVLVAACILLLLIIVPNGRYYIVANGITAPAPGRISGSFTIRRSHLIDFKPGAPFIELAGGVRTKGSGGACLLAHAADLGLDQLAGKHCTRNSDCTVPQGSGTPNRSNWYGYCDVSANQCWVRPGPPVAQVPPNPADPKMANFCNRSIDYAPPNLWLAEVPHPANRAPLSVAAVPSAKQVRWRVAACLNGLNGANCVDIGQEVMGPVSCFDRDTGAACSKR